jgi:hypothetical protein
MLEGRIYMVVTELLYCRFRGFVAVVSEGKCQPTNLVGSEQG